MSVITCIPKDENTLIKEQLVPQFLRLWIKMHKGARADSGKRALALELLNTCPHLNEKRKLSENQVFLELCKELGKTIRKYCEKRLHYSQISALLEYQITNFLGTRSGEKKDD